MSEWHLDAFDYAAIVIVVFALVSIVIAVIRH